MKTKEKISIVIGVLVIAGIAFYGGIKHGEAQTTSAGARGQFAGGAYAGQASARMGGRGGMSGAAAGQILTKDATGFTVKLASGGSRIVFVSASTTVMKSVPGSLGDLVVGQNVVVTGTPDSDGSITANSVDVRPVPAMK